MKKYLCECCGGHINEKTMTCEFCGTKYKLDDEVIRIETFRNPVRTFTACVEMDDDSLREVGAETASKIIVNKLTAELSKAISRNMVVESEHDIHYMRHRIRGTIKMVEPIEQASSLPPFTLV